LEASNQTPSLADFTTTTSELKFSVHTRLRARQYEPIPIFGTSIERDQSITVLAVRLKSVAYILRPLSEYLRTFCAFDFDFIVNHGTPQKAKQAFSL
jgi:hypothetical protein